MKTSIVVCFALTLTLILTGPSQVSCRITRNDAIPTKMVEFRKEPSFTPDHPPEDPGDTSVVAKMLSVLCQNFASISCDVISQDSTLKALLVESVRQIAKHKNENQDTAKTINPLKNGEIQSYFKGIGDSNYGRENVNTVTKTWITDNNADVKRDSRVSTKFYPGKGMQKQVLNKNMKMELKKEKMTFSEEFPTLMRKESRFKWHQKDFSPLMWGVQEEKRRNLNNVGFAADHNLEKVVTNLPGERNLEPVRSLNKLMYI